VAAQREGGPDSALLRSERAVSGIHGRGCNRRVYEGKDANRWRGPTTPLARETNRAPCTHAVPGSGPCRQFGQTGTSIAATSVLEHSRKMRSNPRVADQAVSMILVDCRSLRLGWSGPGSEAHLEADGAARCGAETG